MKATVSGKIMMIAGEASGDTHGANLMAALKKKRPGLVFFGIGGDRMISEGLEPVYHIRQMAFLGFFEVIRHFPFIRKVFKTMHRILDERLPDLVILIDYPGFNLKFAEQARKKGFRIIYYISPQIWAWGRGRIKKIRENVDCILVIFPFEEILYRKAGVPAVFVGHPLKDSFDPGVSRRDFLNHYGVGPETRILGLFPGSRNQEVERLLPVMVQAFERLRSEMPDLEAMVGQANTLPDSLYSDMLGGHDRIIRLRDQTHALMKYCDVALVASGTATLETAMAGTPMVVLYKMAPLSFFIGRLLVRIPDIGLVNIVAGRRIVPELVQGDASPDRIFHAVKPFLTDEAYNRRTRKELLRVNQKLGGRGASGRAAARILDFLDEGKFLNSRKEKCTGRTSRRSSSCS
ncbi:lipid-A-disaccharide synthase [bacterium]|nr:lipid-A-disaccharide synthase [bacterium]